MWRVTFSVARQSACRRNPPRMASHDLENKDFGGRFGHGSDIKASFTHRDRDVFRHRPKAWAVIRERQIVINRFGNAHTYDGIMQSFAKLRYFPGGVLRITAAVIKKIPNVVGPEDLEQPLVLGLVFFWIW